MRTALGPCAAWAGGKGLRFDPAEVTLPQPRATGARDRGVAAQMQATSGTMILGPVAYTRVPRCGIGPESRTASSSARCRATTARSLDAAPNWNGSRRPQTPAWLAWFAARFGGGVLRRCAGLIRDDPHGFKPHSAVAIL